MGYVIQFYNFRIFYITFKYIKLLKSKNKISIKKINTTYTTNFDTSVKLY
jgi:hypothetical protein